MPDIKVRVGQTNAVKVVASAFGGSLTAENAQNAINVIGGIASVTQLYNSGITTFLSNLYVAGITTLAANGGITTTGGDFYVGGDLYINDDVVLDEFTARNANVTGIATVGTLGVAGLTTTKDLLVTGIATIGGATITAGAFENLKVTGISTLSGSVQLGSNLSVSGRIVGAATSNVIPFLYSNFSDLPSASTYHGAFAHVHARGKGYFAHSNNWYELVNKELNGTIGVGTERYNIGPTNATTLNISGISTFAGHVGLSTGLTVVGVSTFTGAIDANGQIIAAETSNQIPFAYTNYSNLPVDPDNGLFAQVTERGKAFYAHNSNWYELVNKQVNGTIGVGTERYNIGPTNVTTLNVSGIATFASDVSIGGTLTYEDVTNIDSVGLITARSGVRITNGGLVVTAGVSTFGGILTTTSDVYVGGDLYISDDITLNEFTAVNGNITGILTAATANVTGTLTAGLIDGGSF
tara:strand:+ start:26629 stop:28029 length:1401 start_codon:yes stop_codon:yes gene_type:complete